MDSGGVKVIDFDSDDLPECDRLAFVREVYGRAIVKHEITPHTDSPFHWRSALRSLPGLALASTNCSGVHTERTPAQIDSDDLVLNITLSGKHIVRQYGRETAVGAGELAVTKSLDVASCDCDPGSQLLNIRVPVSALAPMVSDLDAVFGRLIPADSGPLSLLLKYAEILQASDALHRTETRHLSVTHVHDLIALTLNATRDATQVAKSRGVPAVRRSAILCEIDRRSGDPDLSAPTVALLLGVTPRYVHLILEETGKSFTHHVLERRLQKAATLLRDPHWRNRKIGDIAAEAGFTDLSYFNRAFRRHFGATPSDLRVAAASS